MKVWAKTAEFSEGKFLVVRRDGTTPAWPHFVMGARDPAVPVALRAYALYARTCGFDPAYIDSVRELADDFNAYRLSMGDGDPDAAPHRTDNPTVLALMRHETDVAAIIAERDQALRERDGERDRAEKSEAALRQKDAAMGVLWERLNAAGVDCSDLIS